MTVSAAHSENKDEKDDNGTVIRKERYSGQYRRSFYVGDVVTKEDISASFENGILQLTIPKKEKENEIPEKQLIAIEG